MFATQVIPADLDKMPPGPYLAAILSAIDVDELTEYDRIVVLRAEQRMAAHYQARSHNSMRSVHACYEERSEDPIQEAKEIFENASAEIRAALHQTRRRADDELSFALTLGDRLPRVAKAYLEGDLDERRARVIDRQTSHLSPEEARRVIERIIEQASGLTTGQLTARLRRLCLEADPEETSKRYSQAFAERRLHASPTEAGTENLMGLDLAPNKVAVAKRYVNRLAKSLKTGGDPRTIDQIRADVFIDLLSGQTVDMTGGCPAGGSVSINVDLTTLAELDDKPGELAGYGPVLADIARKTVFEHQDGEWRYVVTDNGHPVSVGTTSRRPTAGMQRTVETLYPTCVFPGCRMPAAECDLDHRVPYAEGGPTAVTHLAPACRHDHVVRHRAGWTYIRLPDGSHRWTSPLGHIYETRVDRPP